MATNNNTEVTFEIMEHIGVLDTYDNREQAWTKEVNIVSWNGDVDRIADQADRECCEEHRRQVMESCKRAQA